MTEPVLVCQSGHGIHEVRPVSIRLSGQPLVPDLPPIPYQYATVFDMTVFAWDLYQDAVGYCPAKDEVSKSIDLQGIWEGYETLLTMAILRPNDLFLDFGAHIGWYSIVASFNGARSLAYEADIENLRLLRLNTAGRDVHIIEGWIDELTPSFPVDHPAVRLLKADVESAENHVVRMVDPLIARGLIDYLLLEISPVFASHYPYTVQRIIDYGYSGFMVPDHDPVAFSLDPLRSVRAEPFDAASVARIQQRNVIFIRNDLL